MTDLIVQPLFEVTDRVIAAPMVRAATPWREGGHGKVMAHHHLGGGDFLYDVLLDGTDHTVFYPARLLQKEPTV